MDSERLDQGVGYIELRHVTEIIKHFNYKKLEDAGIIPILGEKNETKKFPIWVYREKSFSEYGMFLDYLVRRMILAFNPSKDARGNAKEPAALILQEKLESLESDQYFSYVESLNRYLDSDIPWTSVIYHSYRISSLHYGREIYTKQEINKNYMSYQYMAKELEVRWRYFGLCNPKFNQEYNYKSLTAHPDLIVDIYENEICRGKAVIDIKTTHNFSKMKSGAYLQILLYYAILNQLGYQINCIGILLPLQRDIILYNLTDWDYRPFLELI